MGARNHAPDVERKRVLVTVEAYPKPSNKYDSLVCTAGLLEDGSWIRIYPVPLSHMAFSKFDWIELDLRRRTDDHRPETYEPANNRDLSDLEIVGHVGTGRDRDWAVRRDLCCQNTYYSLDRLIEDSKPPSWMSLATFKPAEVIDVKVKEGKREWKEKWRQQRKGRMLFDDQDGRQRTLITKVPYEFRYHFRDSDGRESTMKIIDWELGALYKNTLARAEGDEEVAVEKVIEKYLGEFSEKDLHFFLGTTKQFHGKAPNPFIVIGVFYPPEQSQGDLFLD